MLRFLKRSRYNKYTRSKTVFWTVILLILLIAIVVLLFYEKQYEEINPQFITVAACGCIKKPGVYRVPINSDLATLLAQAQGITEYGDISRYNLNHLLRNEAVYHIPCRKHKMPDIATCCTKEFEYTALEEEDNLFNFLYIGFPAVYFLIQYSISYNIANIIYIPHSAVFLDNNYRIIDLYFTLGIEPTLDVLQKTLNQKIDYYYIQNKPSFIKMIDEIGGLHVNLDVQFADAYDFKPGWNDLDGWHTYEYIRFIDHKRHFRARGNTNSLENLKLELKDIELAYDQRQYRQKKVIQAIYNRINQNKTGASPKDVVQSIIRKGTVESNINYVTALNIFKKLMHGSNISFGTLPGYYEKNGNNVFYIPEGPAYEMLVKRDVRNLFNLNKQKNDQILY